MKVIWIINHNALPPEFGGLCRHFYFSKYLGGEKYQIRIFTASTIHNTDINFIKGKELYVDKDFDGVTYTFLKCSDYKGNGISRMKNMLEFSRQFKKASKLFEKPDVIYASSPDLLAAYSAQQVAKKMGVPCIVEIRDIWPQSIVEFNNTSAKNPLVKILFKMEKSIYKNADRLIFTMPGGRDYIRDMGWDDVVDVNKIYNINNGINMEQFNQHMKEYPSDDPDLHDDKFKIIYTGSIRRANNLGMVLDAAKQIKNDNIRFLIYGRGNEQEELEERVKQENIKNVVFKGFVKSEYLPYILSKSDICLMHSKTVPLLRKYGSSQNKLFDYFAAGGIIIVTAYTKENLVEKYNAGIVLDVPDSQNMVKAINEIYDLPEGERKKMKANGKRVAEEYDYKVLSKKLEELIDELV